LSRHLHYVRAGAVISCVLASGVYLLARSVGPGLPVRNGNSVERKLQASSYKLSVLLGAWCILALVGGGGGERAWLVLELAAVGRPFLFFVWLIWGVQASQIEAQRPGCNNTAEMAAYYVLYVSIIQYVYNTRVFIPVLAGMQPEFSFWPRSPPPTRPPAAHTYAH
jgi:hypothetical protein